MTVHAAFAVLLIGACSSSSAHPSGNQDMFSRADAYERFMGRWSRRLAPDLVAFAAVRDGDNVLDVGSGTGVLSFAARDATKTGDIRGIDVSADYVAYAARQATDPRIRFEVGDAQQLPFPDARFDKTLSLLVINFIPDPGRAVNEMMRVTKSGGVVAAAVWDYGSGMEMLRVFWDEVIAFDPSSEPRDEAHMPLCKQGQLAELWKRHGFENVREAPLTAVLHFASFDDYWAPFLLGQGPAGSYVAKLPKDRQAALAQRLRKRLLGDSPDRAFDLHVRAWAVTGSVPRR